MDVTRAQQIIDSEQRIDVQYEGASVWIDRVDAQNQTAQVHMESDPSDKITVEVQQLREVH
ncbi:H-type small acid-soluble spore protein [Ammoniphilus resinae]|uniref:Small acid-soluble spore protein H (Minor) n=1 Tax=Ammoniphilus resinae TaxID=861532 RepID=A0ABS4GRM4_9BACL|nr:small acid-soluble spore protein H (minor) [Ammoniphilus resinae]